MDSTTGKGEEEFALLHKFHEKHIPYLVVYNKIDLLSVEEIKNLAMSVRAGEVLASAADGMNIQELKRKDRHSETGRYTPVSTDPGSDRAA